MARIISTKAKISEKEVFSDKIRIPNKEDVITFPEFARMLTRLTVTFEYTYIENIEDRQTKTAKPSENIKVFKFISMEKPDNTKKHKLPKQAYIRL